MFGPSKLPQIGANMGKTIREFKSALSAQDEVKVAAPKQSAQPEPAAQQPVQPAQTSAQAEAPKQEQKSA